jgi:hypothetical protein
LPTSSGGQIDVPSQFSLLAAAPHCQGVDGALLELSMDAKDALPGAHQLFAEIPQGFRVFGTHGFVHELAKCKFVLHIILLFLFLGLSSTTYFYVLIILLTNKGCMT